MHVKFLNAYSFLQQQSEFRQKSAALFSSKQLACRTQKHAPRLQEKKDANQKEGKYSCLSDHINHSRVVGSSCCILFDTCNRQNLRVQKLIGEHLASTFAAVRFICESASKWGWLQSTSLYKWLDHSLHPLLTSVIRLERKTMPIK